MSGWKKVAAAVVGLFGCLVGVKWITQQRALQVFSPEKVKASDELGDTYHADWLKSVRSDYYRFVGAMLTFIAPGAGLCQEFLTKPVETVEADLKEYYTELKEHEKEFEKHRNKNDMEGYAAQVTVELAVQWYLAQLPFVHTICETGFNGGHSSLLWLTANKAATLYSFDMGSHEYSKPMAARLQEKFQNRLKVIWGNSTIALPEFIKSNPNLKCDLLIIDGGHTYEVALADFKNFRNMANPKHIVFIDDHPALNTTFGKPVGQMWEERKRNGEILEMGRCTEKHLRGFSFGMYTF